MTEREIDQYIICTAGLVHSGAPVEQLTAALEAAQELEQRGVHWEDAWRNSDDWHRLGRITMLLGTANMTATYVLHRDSDKWRHRHQRRRSMWLVKTGGRR